MARYTLSLLSLLAAVSARKIHSSTKPDGWTAVERASASAEIHLRLTLPSADESALYEALEAVSTPGHERYGKHLSREDAGALTAPDAKTAAAVEAWLVAAGLKGKVSASAGGDVLRFDTTVGVAEELLAPAEYWVYKDDEHDHRTTMRTLKWGVPDELSTAVESAHPTTLFPILGRPEVRDMSDIDNASPDPLRSSPAAGNSSCATNFSPACARTQYQLGDYKFSDAATSGVAIFSTAGHYPDKALQAYLKQYNPAYANTTFKIGSAKGGAKQKGGADYNEEAALDLDVVAGIISPAPITFVDTPLVSYDDFPTAILDFADWTLNQSKPVPIASISYGADESQIYHGSYAVANAGCKALAKMGVRGISVIASSGDSGVACEGKNGAFDPQFPASCPYVTAVGGTTQIPEKVVRFSGAGFSNHFAMPSYQKKVVEAYIKELKGQYKGQYNASGRAYPDVAAYGVHTPIYFEGGFTKVGGTSASCPTVASIVSALNDYSVKQGGSVLGFLNPWIYGKASSGFNDITEGGNKICGAGFTAMKGWDAASGFGTLNFKKLQALLP